MFFSNHTSKGSSGPEQKAAGPEAGWPLPTAADVQAFLLQVLGGSGAEWLRPAMPFCENVPPLSGNILEVHFDKAKNNVDFATRLNGTYDKELAAGIKRGDYRLPFVPGGLPALLHQNGSAFNHGVENIWVEYDAPFNNAPALFFDINKRRPFHPQEAFGCLQEIARRLNYGISTSLFNFLQRIKEEGLRVAYYGLMFSRTPGPLRLTVHGIRAENLAGTLRRLGWKGAYNALGKLGLRCLHNQQRLVIGVDFSDALGSRIGIEVFDESCHTLMQRLYGEGLINAERLARLRSRERKLVLPEYLQMALGEMHQRPVKEVHTRLNHFKFVLDDTGTIKAKGYLYYCF